MKILYIMHVDWAWIKQRPHFLFEEFKKKHETFLIYPFSRHRKVMQKRNKKNFKYFPFARIPLIGNMRGVNKILWKMVMGASVFLFKPDIIWICHPYYGWYIPKWFKGKVVYDKMDDHIALECNDDSKKDIMKYEKSLINNSDLILYSSKFLMDSTKINNELKQKIKLVRNGFGGEVIGFTKEEQTYPLEIKHQKKIKIGYIGTIAEWFDLELIHSTLKKFNNIEFHLIGPCRLQNQNNVEGVYFHSTIEHEMLYEYIKDYDYMIMPFLINDIVKAVDPVKLYEYINFNKNIISVKYDEILRFEPFVYFYDSKKEFDVLMEKVIDQQLPKKYSSEDRKEFLNDNSWAARMDEIEECINKF